MGEILVRLVDLFDKCGYDDFYEVLVAQFVSFFTVCAGVRLSEGHFEQTYPRPTSRGFCLRAHGGVGRRNRPKTEWLRPWGFESLCAHQIGEWAGR